MNRATVIEQLLYEVHDPHNYLTPDVVLDLGDVTVEEIGPDRVRVRGARGKPPPATLKATVCVDAGWLGEAEISYAGPNALARAELAAAVVRTRCRSHRHRRPGARRGARHPGHPRRQHPGAPCSGFPALPTASIECAPPCAARAARSPSRSPTKCLSLYCSGPAGGAGVRQHVTSQISTASILVDRGLVQPRITLVEAA